MLKFIFTFGFCLLFWNCNNCGSETSKYRVKEQKAAILSHSYLTLKAYDTTNSVIINWSPTFVYFSEKKWFDGIPGVIPVAYACSPYIHPVDTFQMLKITSNSKWNHNYPAGTDLSSLFVSNGQSLDVFNQGIKPVESGYDFALTSLPDSLRLHQFTLTMQFKGSVPFSNTLPPVYILP